MVAESAELSGHQISTVDMMFEKDPETVLRQALSQNQPDLVGFSLRNLDNQNVSEPISYIDTYKNLVDIAQEQAPTVLGGSAFSTFPGEMLTYVGATCGLAGHADKHFGLFLEEYEEKGPNGPFSVPGAVWREGDAVKQNPQDVDGFPNPEDGHICWKHIAYGTYLKKNKFNFSTAVITKTGCPYQCLFCDTPVTYGDRFVARPTEAVVEELKRNHQDYRLNRSIHMFVDALFNEPLDHAKILLEAIIRSELKIGFTVIFEPTSFDRELIRLMKRAGCVFATSLCGAANDPMLKSHRKTFTAEELHRAFMLMQEEKVPYMPQFLLGAPGETKETVEETLAFSKTLRPFYVEAAAGIRIPRQSPLYDIAIDEGDISPNDNLMFPHFYKPKEVSLEWLTDRVARFKKSQRYRYRDLFTMMWKLIKLRFT